MSTAPLTTQADPAQPTPAPKPASRQKAGEGEFLTKIRPELNLEKWPAIWRPAKSNRAPEVRVHRRGTTLADGNRVTAEVKVGFTDEGMLTTEDQKTYYGLIKHWEDKGRASEQTFFSVRGLSRILRKKWGTNVIDAITSSLKRLRTTPFTWTDSYENGATGETIRKIEIFQVLSELKIVQREQDGVVNQAVGYFRFNDFILNNLLSHHTKPVLLDVIFQFKSEIAQLLYSHIDLVMAGRDHYERRSRELFDDLGLKGQEYTKRFERKRKLEKALRELRNVRLSKGGVIEVAAIERTKDGTDYKVVFHKKAFDANADIQDEQSRGEAARPQAIPKSAIALQAEQVVAQFHKLFHNVTQLHPQSKEVGQAVTLIANYGFEQAKYIIDFSYRAAAQTNYAPQTFGGILQYTSRALADYDRCRRETAVAIRAREEAQARRAREAHAAKLAGQRRKEGESRLASLPPEELEDLRTRVKADLQRRSHWLPHNEDSALFQGALRIAMITEVMREIGESQPPQTRLEEPGTPGNGVGNSFPHPSETSGGPEAA